LKIEAKNMNDIFRARRRVLVLGGLLAACGLFAARPHIAAAGEMEGGAHDHAHHHHAAVPEGVKRSESAYKIPALTLVRQDGVKVAFPQELDDGRPVVLDFIYTSCAAVCPVTSQVFSELQQKLGKDREKVRMVSISIDPEYDTPARLTEYAKRFGAQAQWQHYTGTSQSSIAFQKAFDVYRGDKMNHSPVTFLRAAPGKPWVRLDGFATPDALVREYRDLVKVQSAQL
jgi:protein SCO1/2